MSLIQAYWLGWFLSVELALLAVLLGGELPGVAWLSTVVPLVTVWMVRRGIYLWGTVGTLVALAGVVAGGITILNRGLGAMLLGGAVSLIGILTGRLLTRRTLNHDLQALVLGLLLVFAGSVLHTQISYGVVFVGYSIATAWALVTRQLVLGAAAEAQRHEEPEREGVILSRRDLATSGLAGATAALCVGMLVAASALFLLFPRLGLQSFGFLAQPTGFPSDVSLRGTPRGGGGGAVVARVRGVPYGEFARGLYLRGPVYDRWTGQRFEAAPELSFLPSALMALSPSDIELSYEVYVLPLMGSLLPTLGTTERAQIVSGGHANPSSRTYIVGRGPTGELRASQDLSGPLRYRVTGTLVRPGEAVPARPVPDHPRRDDVVNHHLELPRELDPRIGALAAELLERAGGPGAPFAQRVETVRRHLRSAYRYTLAQPNGDAPDPLAAFLFERPAGHCEYFAAAFATLLRAMGVPTRLVGGLQGGAWHGAEGDEDGTVVFTTGSAHVWIEWMDPKRGWVADDATPAVDQPPNLLSGLAAWLESVSRGWDDYVVDYNARAQLELFTKAARAVESPWQALKNPLGDVRWRWGAAAVALLLLVLLGVGWWWRRLRTTPRGDEPLLVALLDYLQERAGAPLPSAVTLREAIGRWAPGGDEGRVLEGALTAYEAHRFGARSLSPSAQRAWVRQLRAIATKVEGGGSSA